MKNICRYLCFLFSSGKKEPYHPITAAVMNIFLGFSTK
ncbi:hypothetical protein C942_04919 [Photobacterium marinum]|uniref:Uncharacterized protein n=1 Tax=Photobacterium marinum TaxID=1056511 RepID=L8JFS5_9GAMM|nr:hypothetical protein C942_04919 [Photobacterium marinum]